MNKKLEIINLFLRFLKDNESLNKFESDFILYHYKTPYHNNLISYLNNTNPRAYIKHSFYWFDYEYWDSLDIRWIHFLRTIENIINNYEQIQSNKL